MSRRIARSVLLLAILTIIPACDSKPRTVTVTGSVLRNGQPIPVSKTGCVQIMLLPDVADDQQYTTRVSRCEADGTFVIPDVQPGRYKIGIEHLDPTPQSDKLNGAFRAGDSKVIREVDGKTPINIDLAKPGLQG